MQTQGQKRFFRIAQKVLQELAEARPRHACVARRLQIKLQRDSL
jgi:hypothetical protein